MNRIAVILGSVVVVLVLVGASFWEGMNLGKAQAQDEQNAFIAARGGGAAAAGLPADGTGGAGAFGAAGGAGAFGGRGAGGAGGFGNRGATGTIASIAGNVITLSSNQGVTLTVNFTDKTPILKTVLGSASDLKVGARIIAAGTRSGNNVAATGIQINDRPDGVGNIFGGGGRPGLTPTPAK